MDTSKIFTVICSFVLVVCLVLSITTLVVLRNAVEENDVLQQNAQTLVNTLDDCVNALNETSAKESSVPTSAGTEETDVLYDAFCVREVNGKIGIYTSDGYLIRLLDVQVETLPEADREALSKGICVNSWRELISMIQDYTA